MTKYVRVGSGAVYHYADDLAARKDAVIVPEREFAAYLAGKGVVNDMTRKYADERAIPSDKPSDNPSKKLARKPKAGRTQKTVVSEKPADEAALEELLGDVQNLL